jgi:hypothetical protein
LDALQSLHKATAADLAAARQTLQKKTSRVEKAEQAHFRREAQARRAEAAWLQRTIEQLQIHALCRQDGARRRRSQFDTRAKRADG